MREHIESILKCLGVEKFKYSTNWDDLYEGFEFNPEPRTLIRFLYSVRNSNRDEVPARIQISKFTIIPWDESIEHKMMYSGKTIVLESGDIDYDFYMKILVNWNCF